MPSIRDILRRIKSVKNTAQVTKAMQMVASSKMARAQQAAIAGRPYAELMNRVLAEVTTHAGDFAHPLMDKREVRKRAVIVVSTDKGLCGPLNSNLLREVTRFPTDSTLFIAAGKKGAQFLARTKRRLIAEFSYKDTPQFAEARAISRFAQEMFIKGEADEVVVLFTRFVNTLTQRPELDKLLPVDEISGVRAGVGTVKTGRPTDLDEHMWGATEFLFEPAPAQVLGALLPHSLNFEMYQILLEAKASEQSARMVAMKNATENASQLVKDLTIDYNKMRQAAITKELLEIATAQMALG